MRAFTSCRFIQDDVQVFAVNPVFIVNRKDEGVRFETAVGIGTWSTADLDTAGNDQLSTQFAAAEALALKYLFQCHFHNGIVKEFRHKNAKNVFMSLYGFGAIKNPTMTWGF